MNVAVGHSRVVDLTRFGQSVWLDELSRGLLHDGRFDRLVKRAVISGVTTNPTIFAKAFASDPAYREDIVRLRKEGRAPVDIYELLALDDVRVAADRLRHVYERSAGRDGFVCFELAPRYAHDVEASLIEARRLWHAVARPNLMIKVPATDAGTAVIRRLVAEGIPVNATLIFSVARYGQVLEAYLAGLEDRHARGQSLERVAGVASVFLSRIDTHVDRQLDAIGTQAARALRGLAAIAVARLCYGHFKSVLATHRWQALAAHHAQPQRLLWASTRTKDESYSDLKYVEALIGPDTVTTLPLATLEALRDHGAPAPKLEHDQLAAAEIPGRLLQFGIELDAVGRQLEAEGLVAFATSIDGLLKQLADAPV